MKRLFALAFSLVSTAAVAQIPVLTSANNPVAGEKITAFMLEFVDPGPGGAGITWSVGTPSHIYTDTIVVTSCSSSSHCADFPGATVAIYSTGAPTMPAYYKPTGSALSFAGGFYGTSWYYSNAEDQLRYPFTYNSTYVDTFTSTYTSGGIIYHRWGKITVTADAYGTLVLPYGTFPDVLRVKTDEAYDDTTVTGSPAIVHFTRTAYTWYAPGHHTELLNISDLYRNSVDISVNHYYTVQTPGAAAIEMQEASAHRVEIYPTPANNQFTVHCETEFEDGAHLELLGIDGRTIVKYILHGKDKVIPVSDLAPGIYTCRIFNAGVQVRKLVIER